MSGAHRSPDAGLVPRWKPSAGDAAMRKREACSGTSPLTVRQMLLYARVGPHPFALAVLHRSAMGQQNGSHEITRRLLPPALELRLPTSAAPADPTGHAL